MLTTHVCGVTCADIHCSHRPEAPLRRPVDAEPFWTDVQQDYAAVGFRGAPPPPPDQVEAWHFPPGSGFTEAAVRRYPFRWRYTSADYLAQL